MTRVLLLAILFLSAPILADDHTTLADPRLCGAPPRTEDGKIKRNPAMRRVFQILHPCPSTSRTKGWCPGWEIDHVIPLACGGCDAIVNMQWLPVSIKSAEGIWPKDRWERLVYCGHGGYGPDMWDE